MVRTSGLLIMSNNSWFTGTKVSCRRVSNFDEFEPRWFEKMGYHTGIMIDVLVRNSAQHAKVSFVS